MKKWIIGLLAVLPFTSFALETDNYLTWKTELDDSGDEINRLIKEEIESVLEWSNQLRTVQSCEAITFQIAHQFKTTPKRKIFEDRLDTLISEHQMYPTYSKYLSESIYRNTSRFYLRFSGLAPVVQTKGIYFGIDKLSHFGSTGRRYLKHYLKKLEKGYSKEEAVRSAIRFGLSNEAGILGLWPSGVFSYGDMEANYQGFQFYLSLCLESEKPLLENVNGYWILRADPDIRKYVNPSWDESYNHSYFAPGIWSRTKAIIKDEYCPLRETVQERFAHYELLDEGKSFSKQYLDDLKASGSPITPLPQEICR